MPFPPRLRLLPGPPGDPSERRSHSLTPAQLARSLARTWSRWHPSNPTFNHHPWLDHLDVDTHAGNVAQLVLERLWDELVELGIPTPEVVTFQMFPCLIGGFRPRFLSPVE